MSKNNTQPNAGTIILLAIAILAAVAVLAVADTAQAAATITINQPFNKTYTTGTIPVVLTATGETATYYNIKNGSSWVYGSNVTYSSATTKSGFVNGTYTFYGWATDGATVTEDTVIFTVGAPTSEASLPSVNMDAFWLFFYEGDFFGAFQALLVYTFISFDAAIAFITMLFMLPIYLRTKSMLLLSILWLMLGGFFIAVMPLASGIAIIFVALAIGGLVWRLFTNR